MSLFSVFLIAVGLAMDAFAVSVVSGIAIKKMELISFLRIALYFGIFQAIMPVIGWFTGSSFQSYIESFDHWMAFGLLTFLGVKMAYDGISCKDDDETQKINPRNHKILLGLAIATSIDALVVGVSFAILEVAIVSSIILIGVVTFVLSFSGTYIGVRFGKAFNFPVEVIGGIILTAIGVKILVSDLYF